jgi:hypothetical protein
MEFFGPQAKNFSNKKRPFRGVFYCAEIAIVICATITTQGYRSNSSLKSTLLQTINIPTPSDHE